MSPNSACVSVCDVFQTLNSCAPRLQGYNVVAKVADFGLSQVMYRGFKLCAGPQGTFRYMAPEILKPPHRVGDLN